MMSSQQISGSGEDEIIRINNSLIMVPTGPALLLGNFEVRGVDGENGGSLAVTGTTTLTGALTANGGVATTTLSTSGAATLNSAAITNNATVGGSLAVTGATTTRGITNTGNIGTTTLSTSGVATLNSAVITNNASVGGNLSVAGDASVGGTLDMTNGQIKNVANGTASGDAVNFGQLQDTRKKLEGGIASTAAMANIPLVDPGKTFALGVGMGSHGGQGAFAVGGSYRFNATTVIRGSIAGGSTGKATAGVGVGISW
jgi:hypothetical protein